MSLAPNANYVPSGSVGVLINDNDTATPRTTTGIVFATHVVGTGTRDIKLNVYLPATGSGPWPSLARSDSPIALTAALLERYGA